MLLLIETVRRHTTLSEDTAIGLLFVGMLGLGVVIISKVDSYTGQPDLDPVRRRPRGHPSGHRLAAGAGSPW